MDGSSRQETVRHGGDEEEEIGLLAAAASGPSRLSGRLIEIAAIEGVSGPLRNISEPTVRTHLQHIFAKTGTSRQTELLRLLQNATPPIRAPQQGDMLHL